MQQLAYLGEDGDVKHVKRGLMGAVKPMNLVYLDEDGHAKSANNGLYGAVAPTNLDFDHSDNQKRHQKKVHHSKSDSLQNLIWFDKNGAMHMDHKQIPKASKQEMKYTDKKPSFSVDSLMKMGMDKDHASKTYLLATKRNSHPQTLDKHQYTAIGAKIVENLMSQGVPFGAANQLSTKIMKLGNGKQHPQGKDQSKIQHLAWIDADGNIHKNSEWEPNHLNNLAFLGKDGKIHHADSGSNLLGGTAPSLQNLSMSEDIHLGNTEYALISLWFVFTAIVFGLLYKITNEAVGDELDEKKEKKKVHSEVNVEYLDNSARESLV